MSAIDRVTDPFKLIVVLACIVSVACQAKKQVADDTPNPSPSFDQSRFSEIIPMVTATVKVAIAAKAKEIK